MKESSDFIFFINISYTVFFTLNYLDNNIIDKDRLMKHLLFFLFFGIVSNSFATDSTQEAFASETKDIYDLLAGDFKEANRPTDLDLFWKGKLPLALSDYELDTKKYVISFWGGLYRHEKMTTRAWAFSVCHEIGHILGGSPRVKIEGYEWGSSEGQADYYAAGKCLKSYYAKMHEKLQIDFPKDKWIKKEIIQTAKDFSDFINFETIAENDFSSIFKKDLTKVEVTLFNEYPKNQCRIDTIIAGALCKNWPCLSGKGKRPRCWYNIDND